MLKFALLAATMTIAAPALAQTSPTPAQADPATAGGAMTSTAPSATTSQATPADAAPMQAAPVEQAATQPASGAQVAQVVDTEFPGYDKNSDGKLSPTEFGAWMVALKTKTDPSTKAGTPDTKKWVDAAFAQADTDKNKSLSKTELTNFLSQG